MYQQYKNATSPSDNRPNFSSTSSSTNFQTTTSANLNSPHQNQMSFNQYVPQNPYFKQPMDTNNVYNNNKAQKTSYFKNATSTIVRPTENSFNNYSFPNRNNDNNGSNDMNHTFDASFTLPPNSHIHQNSINNRETSRNNYFPQQATTNLLIPKNHNENSNKYGPEQNKQNSQSINDRLARNAKKNENEKIRIFTGNADKIIKWHKIYKNYFCFYEIIASIVSIQQGTVRLQKIMLLRDKKGPIIQIIHYVKDHIKIENFFVGQMLRCVGRMVGPNIMHGLSIREATDDEVGTLQRMCYISDHAISKALLKV